MALATEGPLLAEIVRYDYGAVDLPHTNRCKDFKRAIRAILVAQVAPLCD